MKINFNYEISVGDGWLPIVKEAIKKIEARNGKITQVKEKFGGLRIYLVEYGESCDEIVQEAENKAAVTCEECGDPGDICNRNGWFKTLCVKHSGEQL